jgi:monothiol glutaredoxin
MSDQINPELKTRITELIASKKVMLFMKGNPEMPQCGFSANVAGILHHLGKDYGHFDILSDMEIRQGLKELSQWPTFPQLYVNGDLVGGNDVITELYESGELAEVLEGN